MKRKIISMMVMTILFIGVMFVTEKVNAETDGTYKLTEQATLTVTGIDEGDNLVAYKILDAYKNDETNEITYRFTSDFQSFLNQSETYKSLTVDDYYKLTSGDITNGSTKTTSTLDKLVSAYVSYIFTRVELPLNAEMTTNGTTASLVAEVGSYLVLPAFTNRVYAVMVGNLDYKEDNGEWVKQDATIVAKVSDPTITTSIKELGKKKVSFNIGEEYSYFMEVTVPQYPTNSERKIFTVSTAVGSGVTISDLDSITILDGEKRLDITVGRDEETQSDARILDEDGNMVGYIAKAQIDDLLAYVKGSSGGFSFQFNSDFITTQKLTISYKAKLNYQAKACQNYTKLTQTASVNPDFSIAQNEMIGLLHFDNSPYESWSETVKYDKTAAFTYRLQIKKHAFGDTTKMLDGAIFEIYSDKELTKKVGTMTTGVKTFQGVPVEGNVNEFLEEYLKDKNVGTDLSLGAKGALRQYIKDTEIEDGSNGKRFVYVIPNDIDVDTFIDQFLENYGTPDEDKEAEKQYIKENEIQYDENRKSYIFFQEMGTEEEVDSFLDYYLTLPYKALFDREKEVIKSYMAKNEITSEKGLGVFSGLGEGDYYLKEVKAPTGYSLLKTVVPVSIHYDSNLQPEGETEYCGPLLEIANQKAGLLPFTGGLGTIIYTVVGSILIIGGGAGLMYYKKRKMVS